MLVELSVRNLGVIDDLHLVLGPGMTALTGETGAGKTLLVEAIELLVGGRADPVLVRPGAEEATVEGRFAEGDDEMVLSRAIPANGRSRAYVDGRMAPATALAQAGTALVDLHGQHAHQSLLSGAVQRAALDAFAGTDHEPMRAAHARIAEIDAALERLGGDARARAREIDLLRFQAEELSAAALDDPDEEKRLEAEEDVLADVQAAREAASAAVEALAGDAGSASDSLGVAVTVLAARPAFAAHAERLRALAAEVADVASEVRGASEAMDDDPARLAEVRERRNLLRTLCRKYGDTLADVIAFAAEVDERLAELQGYEARAAALEADREKAEKAWRKAAAAVARTRRTAAPDLGAQVTAHLRDLALPHATFDVTVNGDGPADDVTFLFAANPGEPLAPLTKVASGGELARVMLAARLVLSAGPPTLVFDEVDAGIGGEAAIAVGRSLAALARERQVLVVTHLAQVAAFADAQVAVRKVDAGAGDGRVVATAEPLDGDDRVVELSRMLSGLRDSTSANDHARELLATAVQERRR